MKDVRTALMLCNPFRKHRLGQRMSKQQFTLRLQRLERAV